MQNDIFISVKSIILAHEMKATPYAICSYQSGRGFYGVSYAVSGTAEYKFSSGKSIKIGSGDVIFLSEDAKYKLITNGDFHHYTVNFLLSEPFSSDLLSPLGISVLPASGSRRYSELFPAIAELWRTKSFGYEMRAAAILYSILSEFLYDLYLNNTDSRSCRRILPAKEYIDAHPTEEMSIAYLAGLVSMSETNFRREFSRLFGDSPIHYRDMRKAAFAKDALAAGIYTVSEVAAICGFDDTSYFSRFFKKHTGMTPSEFKSAW